MTKKKRKKHKLGQQLIRIGTNSSGEICVQVILNIPLKDIIENSIPQEEL